MEGFQQLGLIALVRDLVCGKGNGDNSDIDPKSVAACIKREGYLGDFGRSSHRGPCKVFSAGNPMRGLAV